MKTHSVLLVASVLIGCGERNSASRPGEQPGNTKAAVDQSALDSLDKALERKDAAEVAKAAERIEQEGHGKSAVALLIRGLKNESTDVRETCSEQLIKLAATNKEPVLALMKALQDQDPVVRRHAATALGDIGPAAKEATPALDQLQRNEVEQDDVRKAATEALQRINGLQPLNSD